MLVPQNAILSVNTKRERKWQRMLNRLASTRWVARADGKIFFFELRRMNVIAAKKN